MAVESVGDGGGTVITGKRDIDLLRMNMMIVALRMEIKGLRMTRGRTCYSILKSEYGFKGNKKKVLMLASRLREQMEARRATTPDGDRIIVPETPPCDQLKDSSSSPSKGSNGETGTS